MNYHIIRSGENIEKIAYGYNVDIEEITRINKHISNWQKLVPGTKIKLPEISNQLAMELDEVEPFIEDYYPKIELPIKEESNVQENSIIQDYVIDEQVEKTEDAVDKDISEKKITKNKKQTNYFPYYNYPYPYGYNNYYMNYYRYYTNPKKRSR